MGRGIFFDGDERLARNPFSTSGPFFKGWHQNNPYSVFLSTWIVTQSLSWMLIWACALTHDFIEVLHYSLNSCFRSFSSFPAFALNLIELLGGMRYRQRKQCFCRESTVVVAKPAKCSLRFWGHRFLFLFFPPNLPNYHPLKQEAVGAKGQHNQTQDWWSLDEFSSPHLWSSLTNSLACSLSTLPPLTHYQIQLGGV